MMNKIIEIMPDDMPAEITQAMEEGRLARYACTLHAQLTALQDVNEKLRNYTGHKKEICQQFKVMDDRHYHLYPTLPCDCGFVELLQPTKETRNE